MKIFRKILLVILMATALILSKDEVLAGPGNECQDFYIVERPEPPIVSGTTVKYVVETTDQSVVNSADFVLLNKASRPKLWRLTKSNETKFSDDSKATFEIKMNRGTQMGSDVVNELLLKNIDTDKKCRLESVNLVPSRECIDIQISQKRDGETYTSRGCLDTETPITIKGTLQKRGDPYSGKVFISDIKKKVKADNNGKFTLTLENPEAGGHSLTFKQGTRMGKAFCKDIPLNIFEECDEEGRSTDTSSVDKDQGDTQPFELCKQINDQKLRSKCEQCYKEGKAMWTAIGCIPADIKSVVTTLVTVGIGIGGGLTLLLILSASFMLTISQGDPKLANDAKEQLTSAVIGLLFMIFSMFTLQLIGLEILKIPGFG